MYYKHKLFKTRLFVAMEVLIVALALLTTSYRHWYLQASLTDIEGTPYQRAFEELMADGIVEGYPDGTGKPDGKLYRGQALAVILRSKPDLLKRIAVYAQNPPTTKRFSDVDSTEWYAPYVYVGFEEGVTTGYPDNTFRPGATLSIEEAVTLLLRAFDIEADQEEFLVSPSIENRIGQWFSPYITAVINRKLLLAEERLQLGDEVTRGQFFEMLFRLRTIQAIGVYAYGDIPEEHQSSNDNVALVSPDGTSTVPGFDVRIGIAPTAPSIQTRDSETVAGNSGVVAVVDERVFYSGAERDEQDEGVTQATEEIEPHNREIVFHPSQQRSQFAIPRPPVGGWTEDYNPETIREKQEEAEQKKKEKQAEAERKKKERQAAAEAAKAARERAAQERAAASSSSSAASQSSRSSSSSSQPSQIGVVEPPTQNPLGPVPSLTIGSSSSAPANNQSASSVPSINFHNAPSSNSNQFAISMPSIGVEDLKVLRPDDATSQDSILSVLDKGVGHLYALPGGGGKIMIYGHSSSYWWDRSEFTRIFRKINELNTGDRVYISRGGTVYIYEVYKEETIDARDASPFVDDGSGEELILYTCWPPDSISQRYLVYAKPVGQNEAP